MSLFVENTFLKPVFFNNDLDELRRNVDKLVQEGKTDYLNFRCRLGWSALQHFANKRRFDAMVIMTMNGAALNLEEPVGWSRDDFQKLREAGSEYLVDEAMKKIKKE